MKLLLPAFLIWCDFLKLSHANNSYCPLDCKNGASCTRMKGDNVQHLIALGQTVDSCGPCPDGFVGIACDIPRDCLIAHRHSEFAGLMCHNPVTEYCSSNGTEYCTNGGKCSEFLLQDAFSNDQLCSCPVEFEGPHCEWLKLKDHLLEEIIVRSNISSQGNSVSDAMEASTFVLLSSVVTIGIVLFLQSRRKRQIVSRPVEDNEVDQIWNEVFQRVASSREDDDAYNFSIFRESDEKDNESFVYT
mmetsp:Transcript_1490/g.2023  ORF Transcript_1490/g.2023 Transcript_1490/m.2023 type:complete len:245 (+) Transcript_1490:154-888(+)